MRSCKKLPLCLMEPVPVGFKMDPPLAKAIINGGSASGITYLRRVCVGGTWCRNSSQRREELRLCERNKSADTKVSAEGGGGGGPGTRAEITTQPVEKTTVRQAVPLQPVEVHGGAEIHL